MNIIIAPDKFKGSLTSFEVCKAVERGLRKANASFNITKLPMADGGDGLSEVMAYYIRAKEIKVNVLNPLFKNIQASYLVSADGTTAIIEMAKASGLNLLHPSEYNPYLTTTYGTGQLILHAIASGCKEIIVGIGGSATNEGGIGMAAALGYRFLDRNGYELRPIAANLVHIARIDRSGVPDFSDIRLRVACDVKNLLFGTNGASRMYGPQKGASPLMVEELEKGLKHLSDVVKKELGIDISGLEGGGAAGGVGAGAVAFLNAELISGADLVFQYGNVEEKFTDADIIITGEGKLDEQTLHGKVVAGVAQLGKKYNKPVWIVCGTKNISDRDIKKLGVEAAFAILQESMKLKEAMTNASKHLTTLAFHLGSELLVKN